MSTNDLSRRVDILYRDETGDLGHSFNLMTGDSPSSGGSADPLVALLDRLETVLSGN